VIYDILKLEIGDQMTLSQKILPSFLTMIVTSWTIMGCSTATYYQPASSNEEPGYRDQKIEDNKYRISFVGNAVTPRETVELYLLYRAAELTTQNNFDYFVFSEHQVDAKTEVSGSSSAAGVYGYGAYGRRGFPYYGMGMSSNISTQTHYETVAYIKMQKGKAPDSLAYAFDAKEVMKNIGPRVLRPPNVK
jgi:hypothetical protein